jgi:hypothetical protein
VIEVLLQFKKPVDGSAEEFRVAKSVSNVFVFFLRFNGNIILVPFRVVVISRDRAVQSLLFPLNNVLKSWFFNPRSISDESVLIHECPSVFIVNISSGETEVWQLMRDGTIRIEIRVNSRNPSLIRSIELGNRIPNFSLNFNIVLKIANDGIVSFGICFIVIFVKL